MSDGLSTAAGGKMLQAAAADADAQAQLVLCAVFPTAGSSGGWFT